MDDWPGVPGLTTQDEVDRAAIRLLNRPITTEWIRVWAHEMPALEAEGWRFSYARVGGPSEQLYGIRYRDCWMMREVPRV